ncbi:molybdenum cofactor sulfurase [Danaus plexippus plexippus]|uniref:Molybdenum cofactor sulfurase n=1 Tax=Danaus plexippus plexippus TaxID=278856 RepID=A0A212FC83_DANPL|nr:molybdenum cofactor sulfurase [Danaus plexippus plexippus]XP_032512681.1 molybdenum cofactor sulfurase [Danaus plexippus plexippus]XP_032512682.1 molybdenum cofactor sulfurase [Danaus plexippus plexippus]OWR51340.1 molybdenum cofactor sulfurase [Danaus plexippus plexippus]
MSALSNVLDNKRMQIIRNEFTHLGDKCYLENAGTALYPQIQLKKINEDLLNNVYLNPHSDKYTRDCIEQIRNRVLKHFNTNSSAYTLIFTSGTTQSLKLVVESFKFQSEDVNGSFMYLRDNHTSVLGLREIAKEKNAYVIHITHNEFLNSLQSIQSKPRNYERDSKKGNILLAYPAQTNFNGFKYPLNYIRDIKNGCLGSYLKKQLCEVDCNWYILLDAAAFVASNKLDLSVTQPDFVCLSFYKIFGFPTGLGALLVKNDSADVLSEKKYFGGGTVDIVLSSEDFHVKRSSLHERFEDGTLPFLSIIALKHCFDTMALLIPKLVNNNIMDTISFHTFHLAKDLYEQLIDLKHLNGNRAAVLYMDSDFTNIKKQGAIVAFNLLRENGSYIGYAEFQHMADLFNISVRTGCFCNSGSCQRHLNVTNKEMKSMHKAGHKCGDEMDLVNNKPTGAIRVSFGYYNTFNDVDRLIAMITRCFVKRQYHQRKRFTVSFYEKQIDTNETDFIKEIYSVNESYVTNNIDPTVDSTESNITLTELAIFPVKSCGAFKIKTGWMIGTKGFEYDREWMIVKDNGVCLTQKQNSRMCMIQPIIDLNKKCLTLTFKGMPSISIPLDPPNTKLQEMSLCQSKVCTDVVRGYDCGDLVADWISNALEISYLRLIRQCSDDKRNQKKNSEKMLSLSNQAQFLLINRATVRWLKDKIKDPTFTDDIDTLVDRFRGNIIIDTNKELIERDWLKIIIGKNEFKVEGQCNRCQMVCINQNTGEKTVEPLRTIAEEFGGKLRFGIYLSYIGPINGMKDRSLKINLPIKPLLS